VKPCEAVYRGTVLLETTTFWWVGSWGGRTKKRKKKQFEGEGGGWFAVGRK